MIKKLNEGLILRRATKEDAAKLARFNARIHEEPGEEGKIAAWTNDLLSGTHPTTAANDFLIVENSAGEIVSSTGNIPQTWSYGHIQFPVGRPELVGTDEKWRKKGLVRYQFEQLHQLSDAGGDLMQVITGIPWYYRQFEYSHALDLGGSRPFDWNRPGNSPSINPEDEIFAYRPAEVCDIPHLEQYYEIHCQNYLINTVRSRTMWKYELIGKSTNSIYRKHIWTITKQDRKPVGYIVFAIWPVGISIQEIACASSVSFRNFCLYVTRALNRYRIEENKCLTTPIQRLIFYLGYQHKAYEALGPQLGKQGKSYAWYIRIPNIPKFLMHIRPVLESRLANSVMSHHTGQHKVNLYQEHFTLDFQDGKIISIEPYTPSLPQDGHTSFTRPEFIQLICGHRSYEDINFIHVDCGGNAESAILMNILFPKQHSQPIGIT